MKRICMFICCFRVDLSKVLHITIHNTMQRHFKKIKLLRIIIFDECDFGK